MMAKDKAGSNIGSKKRVEKQKEPERQGKIERS